MSQYLKLIFISALTFLLTACVVDEGALNTQEINPPKPVTQQEKVAQPQVASHQISGKISHGVYSASIGHTSEKFSVMVPQAKNPVDYQYTTLLDNMEPDYTQVRFGPGFYNKNVYRVMVSTIPPDTQTIPLVRKTFSLLVLGMQKKYQLQPIKLMQQHTTINGHSAYFAVYQQNLKNQTLTQMLYIMRRGDYLVRFAITASNISEINAVNGKNRFDVVKGDWQPASDFIDSFRLGAAARHVKS